MQRLLNNAPWVEWCMQPCGKNENGIPTKDYRALPGTQAGLDAMHKAFESLDALRQMCEEMKHLNRRYGILDSGKIPSILESGMAYVKDLEDVHIHAIADFAFWRRVSQDLGMSISTGREGYAESSSPDCCTS